MTNNTLCKYNYRLRKYGVTNNRNILVLGYLIIVQIR